MMSTHKRSSHECFADEHDPKNPHRMEKRKSFEKPIKKKDKKKHTQYIPMSAKTPPSTPFSPLFICLALIACSYVLPAILLKRFEDLDILYKHVPGSIEEDEDVAFPYSYLAERRAFDGARLFNSLTPLMVAIPLTLYLQWSIVTVAEYSIYTFGRASFTSYDQPYEPTPWYYLLIPTRTTSCFLFAVFLSNLEESAKYAFHPSIVDTTTKYCQLGIGCLLFLGWISALDDAHLMLYKYANHTDTFVNKNSKSCKWKSIVEGFGSWYNPSIDKSYAYPGRSKSAAYTLVEVMGVYVIIGKVVGLLLLVLWLIGISLYQNIVILGISGLVAIITTALRVNNAVGNLLPLAMSNAIHVGEIIAVTRTGFTPGDDPSIHLTGLVEGFTWSHIVVRDFRKKQVYLPHSELEQMTISNWSRRPGKLFSFRLKVSMNHRDGAQPLATLAKFTREWIDTHPEIEQTDYKKACIKLSEGMGLNLEIMFYNKVGANKHRLRSEFVVMIMEASKRLGLCLIPAELRPKKAWDDEEEESHNDFASHYGAETINLHFDGGVLQQKQQQQREGKKTSKKKKKRPSISRSLAGEADVDASSDDSEDMDAISTTSLNDTITSDPRRPFAAYEAAFANRKKKQQTTNTKNMYRRTSTTGSSQKQRDIDLKDLLPSAKLTMKSGYKPMPQVQEFIRNADLTMSLERSIHDTDLELDEEREADSGYFSDFLKGCGDLESDSDSDDDDGSSFANRSKRGSDSDYDEFA